MNLFMLLPFSGDNVFTGATAPVVDLVNMAFNALIPIIVAVGAIYCIILGVKLAKAEEQQDREKAKTALKNAIIGFVLIFVLVVGLRLLTPSLEAWMNASAPQ